MTTDQIAERLKQMLVDDLFVETAREQIGLDDGLQTTFGLDSVSFTELRMLCERHFRIVVRDEEFTPENFSSIARLTNLVNQKLAGATHA